MPLVTGAGGPEEVGVQGFVIELDNRPGEVARVAAALGERGVNITGVAGVAIGERGAIGIAVDDEAAARSALDGAGFGFREVGLVSASLRHEPGALADAARRLADAGVNVELVMTTAFGSGAADVTFGVDGAEAARTALGDLAT